MNERPTPETDAFQQQYGHLFPNWLASQFCALARRIERERDEALEWKDMLSGWGGTPELVHEFIKGQQARIHAVQNLERELEQAKQDAKQHEVDCLRALGERNESREELEILRSDAKRLTKFAKQYRKHADELSDALAISMCELTEAREEGLEQARLLGMSGEREAKLVTQRDEALRLVEKWEQVAIGGGTRVLELTKQRDKLAEAAKLIADEYEDRRCQFGDDPLWIKHEQTQSIENALAIIHEHDKHL